MFSGRRLVWPLNTFDGQSQHEMQMRFFHWTKLIPPRKFCLISFAKRSSIFHFDGCRRFCHFLKIYACLMLSSGVGGRKNPSETECWCEFRNMKLFLLFKYETEIEIDSPSGGQRTGPRRKSIGALLQLEGRGKLQENAK